jgi:hypothetical protein
MAITTRQRQVQGQTQCNKMTAIATRQGDDAVADATQQDNAHCNKMTADAMADAMQGDNSHHDKRIR